MLSQRETIKSERRWVNVPLSAATALAYEATLVTHNTREFVCVPDLQIESWGTSKKVSSDNLVVLALGRYRGTDGCVDREGSRQYRGASLICSVLNDPIDVLSFSASSYDVLVHNHGTFSGIARCSS